MRELIGFRAIDMSVETGPVAQLVEQRTFNPEVEGSSPSRLTILKIEERWGPIV